MQKRLADRVIAVFSRVHVGEGLPVVILLVDLFLILTAYYLLKVVREPLILLGGGAEVKSYAAAGQAVLLIALVPAYGWLASRVPRMTLVNGVTALFAVSFVLFWLAYQAGLAVGVPFFLWLGIFNMMVVAQFWSLANELFSESQGKRLFPIIAIGGTIGAIAGSYAAKLLIGAIGIGLIMPIAAALLVACIALTFAGTRAARAIPRTAKDTHEVEEKPLEKEGGFKLVLRMKYLRLIAVMIVLYNLVNTTGEYILGSVVTAAATAEAGGNTEVAKQIVGQFYGDFFTWVNVVAAVLQMFVVSRDRDRADPRVDQGREDQRERRRLLAAQHHSPDALAADNARGEVQGEGRGRQLLRAVRRHARRGRRVDRHLARAVAAPVRRRQRRRRRCVGDPRVPRRPRVQALQPRGRTRSNDAVIETRQARLP
jgi:ATP:ADP antiporter, AAA family